MCNQTIVKVFSAVLLALLSAIVNGMFLASVASAQSQPFLITPYYGGKAITSNFDHQLPTYATDNYLLGFNGGYRTPAVLGNCTGGVNGSCYDGHDAIDFAMDYEPVLAAGRGVVTRVGWWNPSVRTNLFGLVVEIQHNDNGRYITRYAHLSAVAVIYGQTVEAGQIIGTSGSTGNSTGAHLHFGLLTSDRRPVDPFGWTGGSADPWSLNQLGAPSYCLWTDGEWANYCGGVSRLIPAPAYGGQIQIDDNTTNTNGFSKGSGGLGANSCTGDCGYWTRADNLYWTYDNDNTVDSWASWATPTSSPGGNTIYEVQVFVPAVNALPEAQTTWSARYQINHLDGTAYANIDQSGSRGRWISIGAYRMNPGNPVYLTDATGETGVDRRLGADAVRFIRRGTIYLPDIRYNNGGWTSTLVLRNNGGGFARTVVRWLRSDGSVACNTHVTFVAHHSISLSCGDSQVATAVVDSSQDLSAVVEQIGTNQVSAYSGVQPNPLGDPLWATTGGSLTLPYVYKSYYGYTSSIRLLNTGTAAANVYLLYYDLNGNYVNLASGALSPYTIWTVQPATGANFYGSVAIQSTQPLAVLSDAYNTAIDISTQAGAGATAAYLPYIMRNYGGWNSCFVVRNLDNAANNVTITYYHSGGATGESQSIAANAMWTRCQQSIAGMPDGPLAAWITSTSGLPFVLAINQSQVSAGKHMSYSGSHQASRAVSLPVLRRNHSENGRVWSSGFQVQNAGSAAACFTVSYFNSAGVRIAGQSTGCLNPGYAQGFYLPNVTVTGVTDGVWSAIVTAEQPLVVVANATCTSCTGDNVYACNGFSR